jgi:hypothetical protein
VSRAEDDDDAALTWAGGRDPSHYETPEAKATKPAKPAKSFASSKAGTGDDEPAVKTAQEPDARPSMSGIVLVCLGVLGGIYALYTVGWFVSWRRLIYFDSDVLELTAFRVQQVLTILVPALWFGATLYFTRGRRIAARLLWLVLGALLLVPWSFVFGN